MGSVQDFDLITAAENLLKNAKKLAAVTAPGIDDNEPELRRSITNTAKKIAFMTAPRVDVVKEDCVTVCSLRLMAVETILTSTYSSLKSVPGTSSLIGKLSILSHSLVMSPLPISLEHLALRSRSSVSI